MYKNNYPKVAAFITSNNGNESQAKDIFQEAMISMWRAVKQDKFSASSPTAIQGYLYTIAKNKWLDYLRSSGYKKEIKSEVLMTNSANYDEVIEEDPVYEQKLDKAKMAFEKLGTECKNLLLQFYFEKRSLREISNILKLNEASVRNKKYRCMQRLRAEVLPPNT